MLSVQQRVENVMPQDGSIEVIIDPSLLNHVSEQLARKNRSIPPEDAVASLISIILDNSPYPIRARRTGKKEVRISYHIRSFSQPIFE